ncbi:MAG: FliH/SctL family protein [Pseudomonadota bacterium]
MASSSDWIAQSDSAQTTTPAWMAALDVRDGFAVGTPFAPAVPDDGPTDQAPADEDPQPDEIATAFAEGEAAGRAAALAEAEQASAHHRTLRIAFRTFDQTVLDSLAADLADTVLALCAQVLGEAAVDREALLKRCSAAAERMGSVSSNAVLHLHPEDIAMLGEDALEGWKVEADPALERGSLRLASADGAVHDGPAAWRRAIETALKG